MPTIFIGFFVFPIGRRHNANNYFRKPKANACYRKKKEKMSSPAGCCRLAQAPTPTPRPGGSLAASGPPPPSSLLLLLLRPCPPPRGCRTLAARRGRRCGQSPRTQPGEGGTAKKAGTVYEIEGNFSFFPHAFFTCTNISQQQR